MKIPYVMGLRCDCNGRLQIMLIVIHSEFDTECCINGIIVYCNSALLLNGEGALYLGGGGGNLPGGGAIYRLPIMCIHIYNAMFSIQIMVAVIWLLSMLLDLPHFLALERGHYFDPDVQQCMWNRTASPVYTVLIIALIMASILLMPAIYVVIFLRVRYVFSF